MNTRTMLITGSGGLVGSGVADYFLGLGWEIIGIDNDTRATLFGQNGSVRQTIYNLSQRDGYSHRFADIRDNVSMNRIFQQHKIDAVVHAAAQPSHDWAASDPRADFSINAVGTMNMLESTRAYCKDAPFIFMSTNKVYGDNLNHIKLAVSDWRYDFAEYPCGISESMSIDQCTHSLFGVSKVSADLMVQEYGRYFNMPTCVLRPGCISGANQAGVPLHGFLNYMMRCVFSNKRYQILGYDGKQVRDNIHPVDIAHFINMFIDKPRAGEVYNIGGGRPNSCSILEAMRTVRLLLSVLAECDHVESPRIGDHKCYYSDLTKIKTHYPEWTITMDLFSIMQEIANSFTADL